jgi:demethoxyubiquinone hydroxylase (CLK1/Coq7/Cat5 family)
MREYGTWAEDHGRQPSFLATFWGGSGFAFAFGVSRWLILQKWAHAA